MRLTHRHVEVFQAVMSTGQVTRAAQMLKTSQPTVSRELARLEQVLQMTLFERVRGRLVPSARALALFEEVQRSYAGLARIAATAQALRVFAHARLSVACLPALAQALLPQACHRFLAAHPQAHLSIAPLESPMLEQAMTEQRFDLGLTERPEAAVATRGRLLLSADEVAVLPADHPLAARRSLRPRDFEDQAYVSLAPADPYRLQIDALFERHRVSRRLVLETTSAGSVCAMVQQGVGLAIVNPLTALAMSGPTLLIRPVSFSIPFQVTMLTPTLRAPNPLADAFEAALLAAAAGLRAQLKRLAGRPGQIRD